MNTYLNPNPPKEEEINNIQVARASKEEKETQIKNLMKFKERNQDKVEDALRKLKQVALSGGIFLKN